MTSKQNDRRGANPPNRAGGLQTIQSGNRNVQNNQIRAQLTRFIDRVQSVYRFATHPKRSVAFDEISGSFAKNLAVIYDQNVLGHVSPQLCMG